MRAIFTTSTLLLAAVPILAQTLTPREIFLGQYEKEAAKAKAPAVRPVKKPMEPVKTGESAKGAESAPQAPVQAKQKEQEQQADRERPQPPGTSPARRADVQYATVKTEVRPLALRYSVVRSTQCGYSEVDPERTFHTGEQIRLIVQTNDTGYLAVFQEGSSGKCDKVFPSGTDAFRVQAGQRASIPEGDDAITIAEPSGVEKVYIVFSRQSEVGKELEGALKLCSAEPGGDRPKTMLAQNLGITRETGDRTFTRDLVIEKQKVVEKKPSASAVAASASDESCKDSKAALGEAAVYVVNRNAGPNGRVVASFELRHQ